MPLLLIGVGAGLLYWLTKKSSPVQLSSGTSAIPTDNLPTDLVGAAGPAKASTVGGVKMSITVWPIQNNRQFAIAQLTGSTAWVSYWHDVPTKKRKLYRGYEPTGSGAVAKLTKALGITA